MPLRHTPGAIVQHVVLEPTARTTALNTEPRRGLGVSGVIAGLISIPPDLPSTAAG